MKKKYIELKIEVIELRLSDIITESLGDKDGLIQDTWNLLG